MALLATSMYCVNCHWFVQKNKVNTLVCGCLCIVLVIPLLSHLLHNSLPASLIVFTQFLQASFIVSLCSRGYRRNTASLILSIFSGSSFFFLAFPFTLLSSLWVACNSYMCTFFAKFLLEFDWLLSFINPADDETFCGFSSSSVIAGSSEEDMEQAL